MNIIKNFINEEDTSNNYNNYLKKVINIIKKYNNLKIKSTGKLNTCYGEYKKIQYFVKYYLDYKNLDLIDHGKYNIELEKDDMIYNVINYFFNFRFLKLTTDIIIEKNIDLSKYNSNVELSPPANYNTEHNNNIKNSIINIINNKKISRKNRNQLFYSKGNYQDLYKYNNQTIKNKKPDNDIINYLNNYNSKKNKNKNKNRIIYLEDLLNANISLDLFEEHSDKISSHSKNCVIKNIDSVFIFIDNDKEHNRRIEKILDKLDLWTEFFSLTSYNDDLPLKYKNKNWDWDTISITKIKINDLIINKYKNKLNFRIILSNTNLPEYLFEQIYKKYKRYYPIKNICSYNYNDIISKKCLSYLINKNIIKPNNIKFDIILELRENISIDIYKNVFLKEKKENKINYELIEENQIILSYSNYDLEILINKVYKEKFKMVLEELEMVFED